MCVCVCVCVSSEETNFTSKIIMNGTRNIELNITLIKNGCHHFYRLCYKSPFGFKYLIVFTRTQILKNI